MKTKKILETLAMAAVLAAGQAGAAPISLEGSTITATYNGAAAGMLGADHSYQPEPGSNTTALSASDQEFITGDYLFALDFTPDGRLLVWRNLPVAVPGDYRVVFDFGASLAERIGGFTLLDTASIGVLPGLSVLGDSSFSLDLSNVTWNGGDFPSFIVQIDAAAAVPEPGALGLVLAGAAGLVVGRRRKAAARVQG